MIDLFTSREERKQKHMVKKHGPHLAMFQEH